MIYGHNSEFVSLAEKYAGITSDDYDFIEVNDSADYQQKLDAFNERTGLYETGHATEDIGNKILDFIDGKKVAWE